MEGKPDYSEWRRWPGKKVSPRLQELEDNFKKNGGQFEKVKLEDLFVFKGVKQAKRQELIPSIQGGIPYVIQSRNNNMVKRYVDKNYLLSNNEPYEKGNAIVLGVTLPAVSYQEQDFGASQVITARASFLTPQNALYFVAVIKKAIFKFSYTYKPGIERYKKLNVILPIADGNIDFDFIEKYVRELEAERVRELEAERVRELEAYLLVSGLNNYQLTDNEREILRGGVNCKFKQFKIGDIFFKLDVSAKININKRKDVSEMKTSEFQLPLLNAKHGNNGIMFYGRNSDWDIAENVIDVVQNGAIATGDVYPQPHKCSVLWDAYLLKLREIEPSENVLLYLSAALKKSIKLKFSYDNKATWKKVKLEDAVKADEIFTVLMGDEIAPRRKFIEENAKYVKNLDI